MGNARKVLAAGLLLAVFVVGSASPSAASCAAPLPIADALTSTDLVVVGTVTAARSGHRIATVSVEDIWRGDADTVIEVAGGPDSLTGGTSVDRTYVVGQRYLFFIFQPALHGSPGTFGARYEDGICTDTRPYTADLDQLRPASARRTSGPSTSPPSSSSSTTASPASHGGNAIAVVLVIAGLFVCSALVAVAWRLRRRAPAVE